METRINVAKILANCPRDMELDCAMFDDVYFDCIEDLINNPYPIRCYRRVDDETLNILRFSEYGTYTLHPDAKCIIFPKSKPTWEGFVPPCEFKDGDIVCSTLNSIAIIKGKSSKGGYSIYCGVMADDNFYSCLCVVVTPTRLATEDEKERLFKVIRDNGYKWDEESKTLEKLIEPKFRVGDKIRVKNGVSKYRIIDGVFDTYYSLQMFGRIDFTEQDRWELVPDKFDINILKPYKSEVLYRNTVNGYWKPAFWGAYMPEKSVRLQYHDFLTTAGFVRYCIPYVGNEHLLGKQADCSDFYKTWEE